MMKWFKAWLVMIMVTVPAWSVAAEPDDNGGFFDHPRDSAQKLFLQARELQKKGQHIDAEPLLEKALVHHGRADIAAALGESEVVLGRYAEAMTHLRYAYDLLPDDDSPLLREVKTNLARARKHVATLTFRVLPKEAAVSIDEKALKDPAKGAFVLVGEHTVRAEFDGYRPVVIKKHFATGAPSHVELVLTPLDGDNKKPDDDGLSGYLVGAIITGATAAGLAGLGIGLVVAASSKSDDANALEQLPGACRTPASCDDIRTAYEDSDSLFNGATIAIAIGGALGVTAGVLAIIAATSDEEEDEQVRLLPIISPTQVGFSLHGNF